MTSKTKPFLILFFAVLMFSDVRSAIGKEFRIISPDKKTTIIVNIGSKISWSVLHSQQVLIKPSPMSMTINNNPLGLDPVVLRTDKKSVNQTITAVVPVRNKSIPEVFNELKISFKGNYALTFRAYNDGVAYRFTTSLGDEKVLVNNEEVAFQFNENSQVYLPAEKDPEMQSHYEGDFKKLEMKDIGEDQYGYLPLYISNDKGAKMVVTEADLDDYPNLFLFGSKGNLLKGNFPRVILESAPKGKSDRAEIIVKKADYLAQTTGNRSYPWRTVVIADEDKNLLETDLVYKLSAANVLKDTDWIKPGKVAWDWWNDNNIYGVDFKSGLNTATYKYYIDFAAEYGLEYIILDEGWSKTTTDLLHSNPDLDLQELIAYGKSKHVGVILWALWKPLDQQMDTILDQYVAWGVKGIKVDFMARADQYMVNFYERTAAATAKRKLLLDMHGAYKPVGLNRKYPNLLNYEGVRGMENNKWEETISPEHNTTLPFTRMVAGPMDYTPGAMINTKKGEFHINFSSPMSMGTRAHQASMYVIYDSPLQMLCDNPSNYKKEPVFTKYISAIPTTWDKTIALSGTIGSHVVVARQHSDQWYIGGMTNWEARSIDIPLSFLEGKKYSVSILKDGINVGKHASDYQIISKEVNAGDILTVDMAAGGGYTAVLTRLE